jgi:hypothetical protein
MKVLFMSGYDDGASLPSGVANSSAFIQKPFTSRTLGETVREVLDRTAAGTTGQK